MQLLRFRKVTHTVSLELPDGSVRKVKVTTNDARDVQQVEDGDRLHGHVIPAPVAITVNRPAPQRKPLLLRIMGMPKIRQRYDRDTSTGIWKPDVVWTADIVKRQLDPSEED
jgi:hypothetical protein